MSMLPKPVAPAKLPGDAANAAERAQLEQAWANYRSQKAHWTKMDAAAKTAATARDQQKQREQQGNAELEAIQRRVKRQEEGKSTWDGLSAP